MYVQHYTYTYNNVGTPTYNNVNSHTRTTLRIMHMYKLHITHMYNITILYIYVCIKNNMHLCKVHYRFNIVCDKISRKYEHIVLHSLLSDYQVITEQWTNLALLSTQF